MGLYNVHKDLRAYWCLTQTSVAARSAGGRRAVRGTEGEGTLMVTYCVLYQFTSAGMANPKELPKGIEEVHQSIAAMGGKVLACYVLMGEYDSVGIYEFPSDEVALAFLLAVGSRGVAKTVSLKAFTPETLGQVAKNLP